MGIGTRTGDLVAAALRRAKKLIVAVVGFTVLLVGIAMIVLPGPAVVVIPIGLAILATEFLWARHLLIRIKTGAGGLAARLRRGRSEPIPSEKSEGTS